MRLVSYRPKFLIENCLPGFAKIRVSVLWEVHSEITRVQKNQCDSTSNEQL